MQKISLYRKYRPQNFDNLIGQEHVRTTLINALKLNSVAHAYLFTGPRGTGKTSSARLLAKALNCVNLKDGFEPCDECEFCKEIAENRLIDLIEIDAASNRGIDEIRDLKEKINYAPSRSRYKIYIIDEVHMLTNESFNALLKTLEEPPKHAFFILATTEIHKIPATIISRCQRFDFRRITAEDTAKRLQFIAEQEGIDAQEQALLMISNAALGGLRDAIGLMEQLVVDKKLTVNEVTRVLGNYEDGLMGNFYDGLLNNKCDELFALIEKIYIGGNDPVQFIRHFIEYLRVKMHESLELKDRELTVKILNFIEIFQEANLKFYQAIPQLSLELAVIKAVEKIEPSNIQKPKQVEKPKIEIKPVVDEKKPVAQSEPVGPAAKQETENSYENQREHSGIAVEPSQSESELFTNWKEIVSGIPQASLRNALKNAVPQELNGIELVLCFGTEFFKEQVMEQGNCGITEAFLKEKTGRSFKIKAMVKKSPMAAQPKEEPVAMVEDIPAAPVTAEKTIADAALDIFGGEMV